MMHVNSGLLLPVAVAVAAFLMVTPAGGAAEGQGSAEMLKALRPGHPRILVTSESVQALRQGVETDAAMKKMFDAVRRDADRLIDAPTVEFKIVGPRLLTQSRRCLDRVQTLGLVYLLTGDAKYAARAMKELEAAAAFPHWNPSHFLDTAEMSCAFGIGYDWLHAWLNDGQRAALRTALVEKGLKPGLEAYRGKAPWGWWTRAHHNWSQVCNGGLAVGALAIADEEADVAGEILASGLKAVGPAMANFGPDGSWNEGPGYWGYTLMYTSYYLAALDSALGSMQNLEKAPGLDLAGTFRVYFVGPTNRTFNFADAGDGAGSPPSMFFLARTFKQPLYAWHERERMRPSALDLVWYVAEGQGPEAAGLALHKHFRRDDIVFLRSAWEDTEALWVGFKGGDNRANHSHLDLGSFVLDALGRRWAEDLGGDDYNLPGYFGGKRWTYYRLRTESHNTLLINGANQATAAKAPIVAFADAPDDARAVADLSAAYPMAKRVHRGMAMIGRKCVLVQDEVQADQPVDVLWGMVTRAKVEPKGAAAVLEMKGKRLYGRILAPEGATIDTVSANPKPPERQQADAVKLVVRLPGKTKDVRLVVVFSPDPAAAAAVAIQPLADWPGAAK
ncbi:MAG TPA: heparinase II/III family protein [Phycisphaerae bacterium]|nr:heparinase II/III family protein [Phycisphaerae bacterium]